MMIDTVTRSDNKINFIVATVTKSFLFSIKIILRKDFRRSLKMDCRKLFSERIGENMRRMGHEKSRAAVIAISAGQVTKENPGCASVLSRPKERVKITDRYYIVMTSASFRIFRKRPNALRVFFLKKQPDDAKWRTDLRKILKEKIGVAPPLARVAGRGENYIEFQIDSPAFWYNVLRHRYGVFLD